jgi:hypothetical protein
MNFVNQIDNNDITNRKIILNNNENSDLELDSDLDLDEDIKKIPIKKDIKTIPIQNTSYEPITYEEYPDKDFKKKLGKYTFGLDKVIPWEDSNFVFSGGLLYDIITERFSQDLMDIDLFFYGSLESKIKTMNKLFDNLDLNQYSYLIGHNRSVIYVFIQGVPRIIQLIMTDKTEPKSIINQFDLTHVMSYTDGNNLYCSYKTIKHLKSATQFQKKKSIENNCFHKSRVIKYIERGILDKNIMLDKYNWILNKYDARKYISGKNQIKLYKSTFCLTKYIDGEVIDFKKFDKTKIDLYGIFECVVNYNKLDNQNFVEGVDMFGSFTSYMGLNKNAIISNIQNINENPSEKYYTYLNDYVLETKKSYNSGKLFNLSHDNSIYIPCNFVGIDDSMYNDNKNDVKRVLKIHFLIDNENIISYLKKKIDKYLILDSLKPIDIGSNLIKSKYELDKDKIYDPFEIISDLDTDLYSKSNHTLKICAKLYGKDIDEFISINEFDIFNNTKSNQAVNCLFDIDVYLSIENNIQNRKIKYLDINLKPRYIQPIA